MTRAKYKICPQQQRNRPLPFYPHNDSAIEFIFLTKGPCIEYRVVFSQTKWHTTSTQWCTTSTPLRAIGQQQHMNQRLSSQHDVLSPLCHITVTFL